MGSFFWASVEASDFTFHKTLGHVTKADVEAGRSTEWEKAANGHADTYAKKGALLHRVCEADRTLAIGLHQVAKQAAMWTGQIIAHIGSTGVDSQGLPAVGEAKKEELEVTLEHGESGDLWEEVKAAALTTDLGRR